MGIFPFVELLYKQCLCILVLRVCVLNVFWLMGISLRLLNYWLLTCIHHADRYGVDPVIHPMMSPQNFKCVELGVFL